MKKLLAIGEALIDFIPAESGKYIKDVSAFSPKTGGAPANVCAAYTRLGGRAAIITKIGKDPFGDKIIEEFKNCGLDTSAVLRTDRANTTLAFVALKATGDREFSFYRKPGADMLLEPEEIDESWFDEAFCLHFGSVDLVPCPTRQAHKRAIELAGKRGMLLSFDPNLRFPLWESREALKETVLEFMPLSDIVKVSDEEMEFLAGTDDLKTGAATLIRGQTRILICTQGSRGATCFMGDIVVSVPSGHTRAVDTTGAGDGFIGAFLYCLARDDIMKKDLDSISAEKFEQYLRFAVSFCDISITRKGAIDSYPTLDEMVSQGGGLF